MTAARERLWRTLQAAGFVQGAAPVPAEINSPWYVRTLLGISGWLAALCLVLFIGAGFRYVMESPVAMFTIGTGLVVAAYSLLRAQRNAFQEHLGLAISLAGQGLVVFALMQVMDRSAASTYALVALFELALAILMPNFVHRVFCSWMGCIALALALEKLGLPSLLAGLLLLAAAWLWLHEFHFARHLRTLQGVGYGLVLGLLQLKAGALFGASLTSVFTTYSRPALAIPAWLPELLTVGVLLYVVYVLLQRAGYTLHTRTAQVALACALLVGLVALPATGVTTGIVIVLLGFAHSNPVLLGLGIVALVSYASTYYYLLDITLLAKSGTLLLIGLVLLAARALLLRVTDPRREAGHG